VEQSYGTINPYTQFGATLQRIDSSQLLDSDGWPPALGVSERVVSGILRALERQGLVPGQRLIETELAVQYGVGRNAVREAIQQLAARGIVDLSRNRSPSIRRLELEEALEVLEVAGVMTGLLARTAARQFDSRKHIKVIRAVTDELDASEKDLRDVELFNRARRHFYRALLEIAANRELRRLFLTIHMEIIYAQYRSPQLQQIRFADYRAICAAVTAGDVNAAAAAGKRHVRRVREVVRASH
jgi:DNA-binding GntR family transcriptional regulator